MPSGLPSRESLLQFDCAKVACGLETSLFVAVDWPSPCQIHQTKAAQTTPLPFFLRSPTNAHTPSPARRTIWLPVSYKVTRLELKHLKTLRPQRESRIFADITDRAILTFDLDADLRGVFNWNVKQIFVFITAKYTTSSNAFNEVVIWDRIVNRTADARIRLVDAFNEYPLIDHKTELRGTPITLTLNWDVMPITGLLYRSSVPKSTVRMPTVYCTEAECKPEPMRLSVPARPGQEPAQAQAQAQAPAATEAQAPVPAAVVPPAQGAGEGMASAEVDAATGAASGVPDGASGAKKGGKKKRKSDAEQAAPPPATES